MGETAPALASFGSRIKGFDRRAAEKVPGSGQIIIVDRLRQAQCGAGD
jgi:hypothetical protein